MIAKRNWKNFAGLAESTHFKISVKDYFGNNQPLHVESQILSESRFKGFGSIKLISTKDMPPQIVDKRGLRVGSIKPEYLALIPPKLRKHIDELGINISIPLPLIRNRSEFDHIDTYLADIQKHIAIQFYKAIALKTITDPHFVFEGLPLDWETNQNYFNALSSESVDIIDLANKINQERYDEITERDLLRLIIDEQSLDKQKAMVKLILQLNVAVNPEEPNIKINLLAKRLLVQKSIDPEKAQREWDEISKSAIPLPSTSLESLSAQTHSHVFQGGELSEKSSLGISIQSSLNNWKDHIISSIEYTDADKELHNEGLNIARRYGITQVLIIDDSSCQII